MGKLVSHRLPHTIQRGGTFYTNFRVVETKKTIRLSLNTDSFKQAQVIMSRLAAYIPLVQSGAMTVEAFKAKMNGFRDITRRDLDKLLLEHLESDLGEVERIPSLGKYSKELFGTPPNPELSVSESEGYAEVAQRDLYEGSEFTANTLEYLLRHDGVDAKGMPGELNEVAGKIDMGHVLKNQAYAAFYKGDMTRYQQIYGTLKEQYSNAVKISQQDIEPVQEPTLKTPVEAPKSHAMTLSQAWESYVKDKGQKWRIVTAKENQRFFDVLLHVVGDIPVDTITKQHIREALNVVENLPTRSTLPYSRLTLKECIASDVPEEDLISSEHVHKHLKVWGSLFKKYLVNQNDVLEKSPTEGISYAIKTNRGGHYSASELAKLKSKLRSLEDDDWRKWYFLTLIYTGARRGEIANIKKKHIRLDEETSRYYIYIEDGKSDHAQRQIPIHKSLESGLKKLAESLREGDLVFDALPNSYSVITDNWVKIMQELGIPDYDEFGLKRRIHSLRHTFMSNVMVKVGNVALVQFVVGHSRSQSLGISARYTHRPPLRDLLCVVDCLSG